MTDVAPWFTPVPPRPSKRPGAAGSSTPMSDTTDTVDAPAEDTTQPASESTQEPNQVDQLPQWAQRELAEARKDAAKYRTTAQQKDAERQAILDDFAVRLGLKTDEKADPAVLTQQLSAAQQASRDASLKLAIYQAAGKQNADPDRLLDSNTFLANVKDLDPTSSDFTTQVTDAIKAAVAGNTSLRAAQAVTTSSAADHAGGTGEQGPITEAQLARMTPEQIATAHKAGRLNHLL